MRGCIVCGEKADQRCSGCGNVSYCSVVHQVINSTSIQPWTTPLFWRKSTGRHTSLRVHPARLWRVRWGNQEKQKQKTKAFFRSWGTTWLLVEIFPQPLLCLMRRSQCWDRLSRCNTEKYSWRIFFHAGVTHVPWLLLSCTWLQMQVKKTDPRMNLQNAFFF